MINSTFFNVCEQANIVLTPTYRAMATAEIVMAAFAIPPNLLFLFIIPRVTIFCPDLRVMLAHFSFVLLWYCIGNIIMCSHVIMAPPCGSPMRMINCIILELMCVGVAAPSIIFSFLALCVQRLYANLRYKTYDRTVVNARISISLIIISWSLAITLQYYNVHTISMDQTVPICITAYVPTATRLLLYVKVVFEGGAAILSVFTYCYTLSIAKNMAINRAKYDLSSRFQIDQNVRINAILMPSTILHTICHVPYLVLLAGAVGIWWNTEFEIKPPLWRVAFMWRLTYAFLHPIVAFNRNPNLRKQLSKSIFGSLCHKAAVSPVVEWVNIDHFKHLNQLWDKEARPKSRQRSDSKKKVIVKF